MRIVVDWDSTLAEETYPELGDWLPGAVDALHTLIQAGYEVMVSSCRFAPEFKGEPQDPLPQINDVRQALDREGLSEVGIWTLPYKPRAVAYIDDKAIRYEGEWHHTLEDLNEKIGGLDFYLFPDVRN